MLDRVVYWGSGAPDALEALMHEARLRAIHRLRHRERRRLPDRLHLGHHRRAEGHDAFPPRHAGDLRQLSASYVLRADADDRFIGSPPLAFTFGLGGLVLFPLRVGAATVLLEKAAPDELLAGDREIPRHGLLHRADRLPRHAAASWPTTTSRRCANASPPARRCRRRPSTPGTRRPASKIIDGIGSTEMLHIFIGSPEDEVRAGATGNAGARLRGAA